MTRTRRIDRLVAQLAAADESLTELMRDCGQWSKDADRSLVRIGGPLHEARIHASMMQLLTQQETRK